MRRPPMREARCTALGCLEARAQVVPKVTNNVAFKNFKSDNIQRACGIEFQDNYQFGMGPTSSVKGEKDIFSQKYCVEVDKVLL